MATKSNVLSSTLPLYKYYRISTSLPFDSDCCKLFLDPIFPSNMILQKFKMSSKYVSFAPFFSLPCWGNMLFFHHFPNTHRTFVRHLHFSKGCLSPSTSKLGCIPSLELVWDGGIDEHALFASPPLNS